MSNALFDRATRRAGSGLVLVGYRGTGKSTVARLIAERLGQPFADADDVLELRLGHSIAKLFQDQGEAAFRDLEQTVLHDLTRQPDLILATGGGAVLRAANRDRLRSLGMVAWLTTPVEELALRLSRDQSVTRPSLTSAGVIREIASVLASREPLYRAVSDLTIDTYQLSAPQVADRVMSGWAEWQKLPFEAGR